MRHHLFWLILGPLLLTSFKAQAIIQVATVARLEGKVKIFSKPGSTSKKEGAEPQALVDGIYYNVKEATVGDQLELGNMVQTGASGKTRLIYRNGDQITVSESSLLRVRWKAENDSKPVIEVLGGAIRGQFLKGGPRGDTEVKTRGVVMGVRGTDFFIGSNGQGSKVSIMRGEVELQVTDPNSRTGTPLSKPVKVASGFSANIDLPTPPTEASPDKIKAGATPVPPAPAPVIKVAKTSSTDLLSIQRQTVVKKPLNPPPQVKELQALELKAVDVALEDIKREDPKLFEQLKKSGKPLQDADKVNTIAAKATYKKVVQEESAKKPKELEELDDVYDKYFKD